MCHCTLVCKVVPWIQGVHPPALHPSILLQAPSEAVPGEHSQWHLWHQDV